MPFDQSISTDEVAFQIIKNGSGKVIIGKSTGENGTGVHGWSTGASGQNYGVWGTSFSTMGTGVFGNTTSTTGYTIGIRGSSSSSGGIGVLGFNTSTAGPTKGVSGLVYSTEGYSGFFEGGKFYVSGNTGIGIQDPVAKLDIAGQIKINGGDPGNGKVLTSDDDGFAS